MTPDTSRRGLSSVASVDDVPTIMVVDDDRGLADTYAVWLETDYDVRVAYGGEPALDQVTSTVDVIVLDRRMPDLPGDRVLEQLRERGTNSQVLMLTAVEPDAEVADLPFDAYLTKPVSKQELLEVVDELLLRGQFPPELQEYFARHSRAEVLQELDFDQLDDATLEEVKAQIELDSPEAVPQGLDEQHRQFERLSRINALVRELDQAILAAETSEEIAATVCEELADAESYHAAWFGRYTPRVDRIQPQAAAGMETQPSSVPASDGAANPLAEAVEQRKPVLTTDSAMAASVLAGEIDAGEPPAIPASNALCVPVVFRETLYGVLCLGARDDDAFSDAEIEVLSGLGRTVAAALTAVERKKMMVADRAIELEFETTDRRDLFVRLSDQLECRVLLEGLVPVADGYLLCYTTVEDATPEDVMAFGADADEAESVRGLGESAASGLYEWQLCGDGVVFALTEAAATVQSATFDGGKGTVTAQVAADAEVRPVVDRVLDKFPDTDLLAQRNVERSIQSTSRFRESLGDQLTDQQQSALEAAYAAGYFEWPRDSTAEDLAESMGIASPTLHQHLRAALRKLLDTYFEESNQLGLEE